MPENLTLRAFTAEPEITNPLEELAQRAQKDSVYQEAKLKNHPSLYLKQIIALLGKNWLLWSCSTLLVLLMCWFLITITVFENYGVLNYKNGNFSVPESEMCFYWPGRDIVWLGNLPHQKENIRFSTQDKNFLILLEVHFTLKNPNRMPSRKEEVINGFIEEFQRSLTQLHNASVNKDNISNLLHNTFWHKDAYAVTVNTIEIKSLSHPPNN